MPKLTFNNKNNRNGLGNPLIDTSTSNKQPKPPQKTTTTTSTTKPTSL